MYEMFIVLVIKKQIFIKKKKNFFVLVINKQIFLKILSNMWPLKMLAANLRPKETFLAR